MNGLKEEISIALNQFNNTNIFSINSKDIEIVLNKYNLISNRYIKQIEKDLILPLQQPSLYKTEHQHILFFLMKKKHFKR